MDIVNVVNDYSSWKRLFLKLDTLMYLSSGSVVHRGLVRDSLLCSVKRVVRDLPFIGSFFHGIALIFQNKNRLTCFRKKIFVSGHIEPVIEPTNADAPT